MMCGLREKFVALTCQSCGQENLETALFCAGCGLPMADSQAADNLLGREILGTYQLCELLGKGGMSVVYLARHMLTEQEVAVKVLPPELASQKELKTRFIEEARTLARLEHPNIVVLHNFFEQDGHLYLVMQYAEGETFDTIIAREGRVSAGDAVDIGIQVLRALEYAHDQGVIHRDIKPSNFIVRGDGSVKVMDFGLAKFMGSTKLTQTGLTMGTVRYMSPEQVRGKQVDHRSDLYSLGVAIYEAVTGKTPFDGETHFEIMQKHLTTAPPRPSQLADLPEELEATLMRALKKRLENRFQTAREFRHSLQRVPAYSTRRRPLSESMPPVRPGLLDMTAEITDLPRPRVKLMPVALASLLLVLSVGAVVWALLDRSNRTTAARDGGATAKHNGSGPRKSRWPPPHALARRLTLKVDRTYGPPDRLRVMSVIPLDPDQMLATYRKARTAYQAYLKSEGIDLAFVIGPLNLAIVEQEVLNSADHWPDVKPNTDYPTRYQAMEATLYVRCGAGFQRTDLPYGLALHYCARIVRLSNDRCLELAEGFEHYFSRPE